MLFYDNGQNYKDSVRNFWNQNVKKYRITAIISGIIMLVLGIMGIIWPLQSTIILAYVIAAAMIVFGIVKIVGYTKTPAYLRTGLALASGILDLLLGVMLIFSGTEVMLYTLSYFFAFELIIAGIEELTFGNRVRFYGFDASGGFTFSGILNIIIGTVLLFMPGASLLTMSMMVIIFLITKGILLIVDGVKAGKLDSSK
jgi:uncharacterized membrane protein HdeD (DUF308 family)